jgi:hypothetical protein
LRVPFGAGFPPSEFPNIRSLLPFHSDHASVLHWIPLSIIEELDRSDRHNPRKNFGHPESEALLKMSKDGKTCTLPLCCGEHSVSED